MTSLTLPKNLDSKKDIEIFVNQIIPDNITGDQAVQAIVLAKKLDLVAEKVRAKVETQAWAHVNDLKSIEVDGATLKVTQPKELAYWVFSEELEQLREVNKREIAGLNEKIVQLNEEVRLQEELEKNQKTAKYLTSGEMKKGTISVTVKNG